MTGTSTSRSRTEGRRQACRPDATGVIADHGNDVAHRTLPLPEKDSISEIVNIHNFDHTLLKVLRVFDADKQRAVVAPEFASGDPQWCGNHLHGALVNPSAICFLYHCTCSITAHAGRKKLSRSLELKRNRPNPPQDNRYIFPIYFNALTESEAKIRRSSRAARHRGPPPPSKLRRAVRSKLPAIAVSRSGQTAGRWYALGQARWRGMGRARKLSKRANRPLDHSDR